MKKLFFLLILFSVLIVSCNDDSQNLREKAMNSVEELINREGVNVYMSRSKLKPGQEILTWGEKIISPNYESWLIFIDEHPFANWTHPCKYVFVNSESQQYEIYEMNTGPDELHDMDIIKEVPFEKDGKLFDFSDVKPQIDTRNANMNNKYAVIISGGGSRDKNYIRYWNDCSAMYSALIKVYGYKKDNISVLISDGTNPAADRCLLNNTFDSSPLDLDGDGIADTKYSATKSSVNSVINALAGKLTSNDELFIFVTDHGGITNNLHQILLWDNTLLSSNELASLLRPIKAKDINIVMGQCNSGGFITV